MNFNLGFFNPYKPILGLDIGTSSIKLVELRKTSTGIKLVNCAVHEFDFDPEDKSIDQTNQIIISLQNMLAENNINPSQVVIAVPGQSVFTRYVKLPAVEESKMNQIISYEAQQQVPFPIDEVVWDYQVIGDKSSPELNVVLVAIKAEIISRLIDSVAVAKLDTDIVDVAPLALCNSIIFNQKQAVAGECTGVLEIGAKTTNFVIIEGDNEWTRSIPIAGNMITRELQKEFSIPYADAEKLKRAEGFVLLGTEENLTEKEKKTGLCIDRVIKRLYAEISRSIGFYRTQSGGSEIKKLMFAGGTSQLKNLKEYFGKKLNVAIETVEPFSQLEIDPFLGLEELASSKHLFSGAVGLALRKVHKCAIQVNLMPKKIARQREIARRKGYIILSAVVIYIIMLTLTFYSKGMVWMTNARISQYTLLIEEMQGFRRQISDQKEKIDRYENQMELYKSLFDERVFWVDLILELEKITPENIWISRLFVKRSSAPEESDVSRTRKTRSVRGSDEGASEGEKDREMGDILVLNANTTGVFDDVNKYFNRLKESSFFIDAAETRIVEAEKHSTEIRKFTFELKFSKNGK
ncbi:MAG: type IV pilus assembly protein PilM [bacterium]|nr:type IV pilus assembly protein PilM [bacterium]